MSSGNIQTDPRGIQYYVCNFFFGSDNSKRDKDKTNDLIEFDPLTSTARVFKGKLQKDGSLEFADYAEKTYKLDKPQKNPDKKSKMAKFFGRLNMTENPADWSRPVFAKNTNNAPSFRFNISEKMFHKWGEEIARTGVQDFNGDGLQDNIGAQLEEIPKGSGNAVIVGSVVHLSAFSEKPVRIKPVNKTELLLKGLFNSPKESN